MPSFIRVAELFLFPRVIPVRLYFSWFSCRALFLPYPACARIRTPRDRLHPSSLSSFLNILSLSAVRATRYSESGFFFVAHFAERSSPLPYPQRTSELLPFSFSVLNCYRLPFGKSAVAPVACRFPSSSSDCRRHLGRSALSTSP